MLIDASQYLKLPAAPQRLRPKLDIHVSEHAFLPSVDEILSDWVATIATPAFKLIRQQKGPQASFCSIGTGVGLDALSAIETLGATQVGITDVHEDVVTAAVENIRGNLRDPDSVTLQSGYGDLLEPLALGGATPRYDIIYENLPNIPVADVQDATLARKSSGHIPPRAEPIPALMRKNLLALHYLALVKARDFLAPDGAVISLIGGRIPLDVFQEMGRLAGYRSEIFTYSWKIQTDPEEIISGHLRQQEEGFGPYHFYRTDRLAAAFNGLNLEESGTHARDIERQLALYALSPQQALDAWKRGEIIGHTAVALRSTLA